MAEAFKRGDIRKILIAAGTPEDNVENAISEIFKPHIAVVDGLKNQIEELETKAKTADKLKTELASVNAKYAELEEADYKAKYEAEKAKAEKVTAEFENFKTEQGKKAERAVKETAFKDILKDAGIPERHWNKIIKYSDIDGMELDKDNKPKNAKELLDGIKAEWSDHIETVTEIGTNTPTPPAGQSGKKPMTADEILKIADSKERLAAIQANPEAFKK